MQRIIDSHQHFWQLSRNDYGWLTADLKPLYQDFLPNDLKPHLTQQNIYGTILVQAAPTIAETQFLLDLAEKNSFILGVVGWVDMEAEEAPDQLAKFAEHSSFCGIRPMIQDIQDIDWMLQKKIASSFKAVETFNLTFDALVLPKHLTNLIQILERYPGLRVVIDHGAKPLIKEKMFEPWASEMKIISSFPNVYCKFSGLVTEAGSNWSWSELQPYVDHLFSCFGYQRMMWGSDYPVLNLVSHYQEWYELCRKYINQFGREASASVFGEAAERFYQL